MGGGEGEICACGPSMLPWCCYTSLIPLPNQTIKPTPSTQDMDGACECAIKESPSPPPHQSASLTVTSCMFHEVLSAEGKPHLLENLCCQHNLGWLEAYRGQGVESELGQCLARGDACCRIDIGVETKGG